MAKINFQNVHTMVGSDARIEGPVRIAQNGSVIGTISGSDIRVGGNVVGNLVAEGQVVLGRKCVLKGDIVYRKLLIEDGAQFEGKCDLASTEKESEKK